MRSDRTELGRPLKDITGYGVAGSAQDVLDIAAKHCEDPVPELLAARRAENSGA